MLALCLLKSCFQAMLFVHVLYTTGSKKRLLLLSYFFCLLHNISSQCKETKLQGRLHGYGINTFDITID